MGVCIWIVVVINIPKIPLVIALGWSYGGNNVGLVYLFLKPDQAHTPFHRENSSSSHACLTRAPLFRLCVSWMDVVSVVPVVFSLMSYRMFAKPVDYSGNFQMITITPGFLMVVMMSPLLKMRPELVFQSEKREKGSDKARMSSFSADSDQRSPLLSERSL